MPSSNYQYTVVSVGSDGSEEGNGGGDRTNDNSDKAAHDGSDQETSDDNETRARTGMESKTEVTWELMIVAEPRIVVVTWQWNPGGRHQIQ